MLVIGGGGREHALVWSLAREGRHELYCAPGNAGTAQLATNSSLDGSDPGAVSRLVSREAIDLTIVGPEGPLASGVVDQLQQAGQPVFGPVQAAARLESSKLFARQFMEENGIAHPAYLPARSPAESREAAATLGLPVVLKADGLAAGKGVIICQTNKDVEQALDLFFNRQAFGEAGLALSVEECLMGTELSVFAICDGERALILGTAQDYKRAFDGNRGPNTGGMGSIAPSPLADKALLEVVTDAILQPTLDGMQSRGTPFVGFLYAGLMIVDGSPVVIEFNVRLGDPESQVVLPLLDVPLYDLVVQALAGELPDTIPVKEQSAVCIVLAAEGYPGAYERGTPISGLDTLDEDLLVFHAGTTLNGGGTLVSRGGRVLSLMAVEKTISAARQHVVDNIPRIGFPGSFYRSDIGQFNRE